MVAHQRRDDERDVAMALAWHVAALSRAKKLPELRTLLSKARRPQTVDEQKSMLNILSQQYGIPLRRAPKGRRIRG